MNLKEKKSVIRQVSFLPETIDFSQDRKILGQDYNNDFKIYVDKTFSNTNDIYYSMNQPIVVIQKQKVDRVIVDESQKIYFGINI